MNSLISKKTISKRIVLGLALAVLFSLCLFGCGGKENNGNSKKISIVTTIFPEYDWVREIIKGSDNCEVTFLLDKGVDLHSFQPSADDIVKISSCDILIYVGGESDKWIKDEIKIHGRDDTIVIDLMEVLGDSAKEEEIVEGMEAEEEEAEEEGEEEPEYDEHVWLSLKNAKVLTKAISDAIIKADPDNKDLYTKNTESYIAELDKLDKEYEAAIDKAEVKTVVFGDRFPFRYLVDDYNIKYYAAFVGCSAESEASFETITFLSGKIDELGLDSIFMLESSDGRIADTIVNNTKAKNQQVLTLDSMQSVTEKDVSNGDTYLGIMRKNLEELVKAVK